MGTYPGVGLAQDTTVGDYNNEINMLKGAVTIIEKRYSRTADQAHMHR